MGTAAPCSMFLNSSIRIDHGAMRLPSLPDLDALFVLADGKLPSHLSPVSVREPRRAEEEKMAILVTAEGSHRG